MFEDLIKTIEAATEAEERKTKAFKDTRMTELNRVTFILEAQLWKEAYISCIARGDADLAEGSAKIAVEDFREFFDLPSIVQSTENNDENQPLLWEKPIAGGSESVEENLNVPEFPPVGKVVNKTEDSPNVHGRCESCGCDTLFCSEEKIICVACGREK